MRRRGLTTQKKINRRRTEARCLIPFVTTAAAVAFPFVEQAARLTRCFDSQQHPAKEIATEYLRCSRPAAALAGVPLLQADRAYWGIETGLTCGWTSRRAKIAAAYALGSGSVP